MRVRHSHPLLSLLLLAREHAGDRLCELHKENDHRSNPRSEDGVVVTAPWMAGGHTVYVAVGNLFAYLCIAATLILMGVAARRNESQA